MHIYFSFYIFLIGIIFIAKGYVQNNIDLYFGGILCILISLMIVICGILKNPKDYAIK